MLPFAIFFTDTDMWLSLLIGLFLSDLRNIYAITLNFGNQNQVSYFKHFKGFTYSLDLTTILKPHKLGTQSNENVTV